MRVRSEWITIVTVTGLAVCGFALPRHAATQATDAKRRDIAAAGIDFMPTGTIKTIEKTKAIRRPRP